MRLCPASAAAYDRLGYDRVTFANPFDVVATQGPAANPSIPKPSQIFGGDRANSRGYDLTDPLTLAAMASGSYRALSVAVREASGHPA